MNNKKAISLVEVMIVMTIIAIIASIFLAMPKKDVTKTDKVKYYVAYNMLNTMQNERLAQTGDANLNDFCTTVRTWLNVTEPEGNCRCGEQDNCVTLINGMNLLWPNLGNATNNITIDLDGVDNGLNTDKKDRHNFTLHTSADAISTPLVEPDISANDAAGKNATWCEFRVYQLNAANAHKNYDNGKQRATYEKAKVAYDNCNNNNDNSCFIEIVKQGVK